jgi:hypothetical protein
LLFFNGIIHKFEFNTPHGSMMQTNCNLLPQCGSVMQLTAFSGGVVGRAEASHTFYLHPFSPKITTRTENLKVDVYNIKGDGDYGTQKI